MAFVSESLEQFLLEYRGFTREEDRWADRELDKWEKKEAGVDINEDPVEILTYPEEVEAPVGIENIKRILRKVVDYKAKAEVSPDEFKNFCIWITRTTENPYEASAIVSAFIENVPAMVEEFESEAGKLDGGKYHEGMEVLANAYRPKEGGPGPAGPPMGRDM